MNLDELRLILDAQREKDYNWMKFQASLKGVDLDKFKDDEAQLKVQKIKDRAAARQRGENPEISEWRDDFGTEYEIEVEE